MDNILRDSIWQGLGAIIAFLTLLLSVLFLLKKSNRKDISYRVILDTPLLSIRREVEGRIQITIDGYPVHGVRLAILRLWNSGDIPIVPDDYIEPITFFFGKDTEILDAQVIETNPNDLKVSLMAEKVIRQQQLSNTDGTALTQNETYFRNLTFEPLLLNSKDSFTLKVLLSQVPPDRKFEVNGRIVGVRKIQNSISYDTFQLNITSLLLLCSLILIGPTWFSSVPYDQLGAFAHITLYIGSLIMFITIPWFSFVSRKFIKSQKAENESWTYFMRYEKSPLDTRG